MIPHDSGKASAAAHPPTGMSNSEWLARLELAACYRLFDWLGWSESIYNHITLRVEEANGAFLINEFGLHYGEVTASNLIRVDPRAGEYPPSVNPAGMVIHSAIHEARSDAHCVMHTHTTAGMAIACKEGGLRPDNFYSAALHGLVAYHDFEGITTQKDEQPRLVESLGDREVLVLRNHGLLALGPHVPGAFSRMWSTQRACEVQCATDSIEGPNRAVSAHVLKAIPNHLKPMVAIAGGARRGELAFEAMVRKAGISYTDLT